MDAFAEWIQVLQNASEQVADEGEKVVKKGCLNIKTDWRARWSGFRHLPLIPYSITYDTYREGLNTRGEIGPDKDLTTLQGPLGAILEFGAAKQNTAPHPGGSPALDAEGPRFEQYVGDLGEKLLEGQ